MQVAEDLSEEEVQKLRDLFDEYDVDGSGEITRDELYAIVENVIGRHTSAIMLVDVSVQLYKGRHQKALNAISMGAA